MSTSVKQMDNAIRAVRKETLKGLEKASDKCLALFPDADKNPETARLVLKILATQAYESYDLFVRQFAIALDASLDNHWFQKANAEIEACVKEMEAGV